jgi:Protein tyrosine phosphatase-like protein, PTPLA
MMIVRAYLVVSNAIMMAGWANVFRIIVLHDSQLMLQEEEEEGSALFCNETLKPALGMALTLSFIEVLNALMGVTRSKPHLALLFSCVRAGVSYWIAPLLVFSPRHHHTNYCRAWQTMMTVTAWSFGDSIRFACFCLDSLVPGGLRVAKAVRYTVAPLLFPIGFGGEFLMIVAAARNGRPLLFAVAALWPFGFYVLMKQLIKQRRKFFATSAANNAAKASSRTSAPKEKAAKVKAV